MRVAITALPAGRHAMCARLLVEMPKRSLTCAKVDRVPPRQSADGVAVSEGTNIMSSTIQTLGGLIACVAWLLTLFELKRIFNRPDAWRLFKIETVQMLMAVLLVALVVLAIALLTMGLVGLLPFGQGGYGILGAFVLACVIFFALFMVIGAMFSPLAVGREGAEDFPK